MSAQAAAGLERVSTLLRALSYVFGTIFRGFLLGVGLCVALGAIYLAVMQITMRQSEAVFARRGIATENSAKGFVLSDVEELNQYSTYIAGSVEPGESRNFKIACRCNAPPAEHDSYKLEAIP